MVPEAPLEQTDAGLAPAGEGWFVMNARDARWREKPGRGVSLALTGSTDWEAETLFPMLGVNISVIEPGQPSAMYHWENDAEAFLVLYGEALLLVEGQERPLKQWDFVHFPPKTAHIVVGAGDGPCAILMLGSRQFMTSDDWGCYVPDPVAAKYGCSVEEETADADLAYSRFGESTFSAYREGWLPGE
jgi:mannose-6-phosphate isomerase-like protein (cupin superfamily)